MDASAPREAIRTPLLEVEGLTVRYPTADGHHTAVRSASIRIERGQKVAIVGESGSGKSNVCLAIVGFLAPTAELDFTTLRFDGRDLEVRPSYALPRRHADMAVVFQNAMTSLDPVWTIESQLVAAIRGSQDLSKSAARALAADWVARVGMRDVKRVLGSRPYELSGGMRQRAMLAIALSTAPKLLIADEPTSALDATLSSELMQLMVDLTEENDSALLMVSHDIGLCRAFTDWTIVMKDGDIVEQGPSAVVTNEPVAEYTRNLIACVPTLDTASAHRLPTMEVLS